MWVGLLLHHVVDEHEWIGGECSHQPLTKAPTDGSSNAIPYFTRKEAAFKKSLQVRHG